eukprot:scaffold8405_cov169-Amphora_coffeaeformis.AAC.4
MQPSSTSKPQNKAILIFLRAHDRVIGTGARPATSDSHMTDFYLVALGTTVAKERVVVAQQAVIVDGVKEPTLEKLVVVANFEENFPEYI